MKPQIKIRFVDFWSTCDFEHHVLTTALREHYDVEIVHDNSADIYFCSVFGDEHLDLPSESIKIFYTGENVVPDFNLYDYGIGFEWMDYGDRYFRLPNYYNLTFRKDVELVKARHLNVLSEEEYAKKEFCSFVVSNGNDAAQERERFFDLLSEYKKVDSGGRYRNNIGGPVADKREFESQHKFAIAFENSSHAGYSTEKIVNAFAAGTVPIYWGDPEIARIFNPEAFVNVMDYPTLEKAVERVIEIDKDIEKYMTMRKAPAFVSNDFDFDVQYQKLVDFLQHIAEQPKVEAQRYNREFWGKRYIAKYKGWRDQSKLSIKEQIINKIKSRINR